MRVMRVGSGDKSTLHPAHVNAVLTDVTDTQVIVLHDRSNAIGRQLQLDADHYVGQLASMDFPDDPVNIELLDAHDSAMLMSPQSLLEEVMMRPVSEPRAHFLEAKV